MRHPIFALGADSITVDTALRLARYFNNAPAFWLKLATSLGLEVAEDEISDRVRRDLRPSGANLRHAIMNSANISSHCQVAMRIQFCGTLASR